MKIFKEIMSKDTFCKIINQLESAHKLQNDIYNVLQNSNGSNDILDICGLSISFEDRVVSLLQYCFNDKDTISYFLYDTNFGNNVEAENYIIDSKSFDISTAEKLYDCLVNVLIVNN